MKHELGVVYSYTRSVVIHNSRAHQIHNHRLCQQSSEAKCIGTRRGNAISITQLKLTAHGESTSLHAQKAYEGLIRHLGWTSGSEVGMYVRANTRQVQASGTDRRRRGEESKPRKPVGRSLEHGTAALGGHRHQSAGIFLDFSNVLPRQDSLPYISGLSNTSCFWRAYLFN